MSIFDSVAEIPQPKKNKFNLSKEVLLTANPGLLIPCFHQELIPGDLFKITPSAVIKSMPLISPAFGTIRVDFHAFFVPYRLLWRQWPDWIFNPDKEETPPFINLSKEGYEDEVEVTSGSLADYLGLPLRNYAYFNVPLNSFNFQAYHLIYNEYFRDEDLQDSLYYISQRDDTIIDFHSYFEESEDETISFNDWMLNLYNRAWRKDYFTSARPFTQKGASPIMQFTIPAQSLPVTFNVEGATSILNNQSGQSVIPGTSTPIFQMFGVPYDLPGEDNSFQSLYTRILYGNADAEEDQRYQRIREGGDSIRLARIPYASTNAYDVGDQTINDQDGYVKANAAADDVNFPGFSISELRSLFAIQKYLEINAVAGSRYIEGTLAHYGVRVADYKAQIPEFLGMCSFLVQQTEVVSHEQQASRPQGTRTGNYNLFEVGQPFRYFAQEHGVIMVLMSIMAESIYPDGIQREYLRRNQFDFALPLFQHLGEQEVYNYELYIPDDPVSDGPGGENPGEMFDIFGYQSRYAEYRSAFSSVHGEFRPGESLEFWTLARKFDDTPELNADFIMHDWEKSDLYRVFAIKEKQEHHFYCDLYFKVDALRPLKYHTVPALIG